MITLQEIKKLKNVNLVMADTGEIVATETTPVIMKILYTPTVHFFIDRHGLVPFFDLNKLEYRPENNTVYFEL